MTSHRALAMAHRTDAPPRAVRVTLVFVDEISAHVHRHRGFSSCWYLVPRTAKLVGDLMHAITHEFELLERCTGGIELLLDGIHVLANQAIDIIRDSDTLAVQCASTFVSEQEITKTKKTKDQATNKKRDRSEILSNSSRSTPTKKHKTSATNAKSSIAKKSMKKRKIQEPESSSSSSESDDESPPPRASVPRKKTTAADSSGSSSDSDSEDSFDAKEVSSSTITGTKNVPLKPIVKETTTGMWKDVPLSSTDSSSSSSDSSSSTSDDDSDTPAAPVTKPKRVQTTTRVSNGKPPAKNKNTAKDSTEIRTRRRRRPRRRPKGEGVAEKSPLQAKKSAPAAGVSSSSSKANAPPTVPDPPKEIRPLRIRGLPPGAKQPVVKNHFRFDGTNNQQQATKDSPSQPHAFSAPRAVASYLQKYGPTTGSRPTQAEPQDEHEEQQQPKKKNTQKEMWKRPYEIVASILNDDTSTATTTNKPTLESLVPQQYLAKPSDPISFPSGCAVQKDDIIAYKTLSLCLETWQPVLSDWLCAKVVRLDPTMDTMLDLLPHKWVLPADNNGKLSQIAASEADPISITLGEISELFYVDGPTKTHLEM